MKVNINRQAAGLEDLLFGVGTVEQDRQGELVTITMINASNLPFDEGQTLAEVLVPINEQIIPNLPEILLADTNATTATTKAGEALASANAAAISEVQASLSKWEAEASKRTSDSYATEAEDVFVKQYTSNGDGTYTIITTTDYSAFHWKQKAEDIVIGTIIDDTVPKVDRAYSSSKTQDLHDSQATIIANLTTASGISVVPAGTIVATNVQNALQELDSEKLAISTYTTDMALKADLVAGKVPSIQLPSYVDDVLEFANFATFPVTGEIGKLYITIDTNRSYRWAGSNYIDITGMVDSVAGKVGAVTLVKADVGLNNVDNTADLNKPISTMQAAINLAKQDSATAVTKDSDTGAAYLPTGTTAQRPAAPANGYMRYNSELLAMEAYTNGVWGSVGGGATGGGADTVFVETSYTVTQDYTITAGKSAITIGDANGNVTISDGVTISIPDGASWVVVGA